jgi:cell division protein FtsB
MITIAVAVQGVALREKINAKAAEEQLLDDQIEDEKARAESIEEFSKEVQTKGYIEEVAREKLGLVYEDEIMFKEDN